MGWSRRIGIIAALLIGGVSVVFAGQALLPNDSQPASSNTPAPAATPTLPLAAAPELLPPPATLTTEPTITLSGTLSERLSRDGEYRLRIYINGQLERERKLPRRDEFTLDVPLIEGPNSITLAVSGPAGESLHSAPVEVTLDTTRPQIRDLEPANGQTIYSEQVLLRGSSEAGASLTVSNHTDGASGTLVVSSDGTFEVPLSLLMGFNEIRLSARDSAGNQANSTLTLERREGSAAISFDISRAVIPHADLPVTVSLHVEVIDEARQPVDGAEVTFSLSPPGMPTLTYNATTVNGVARWPSVRISSEAGHGQGLATVFVTLADGQTLTSSAYFEIKQ